MARLAALLPLLSLAAAQSISTNTPTPPLQWINLGAVASGSPPQPVRDACIGYEQTSGTIVVFGGSSSAGTPSANTYVLSTSSLTWASPTNNPGLGQTPPARSLAVCGFDSASSYRSDMAMYGGLGNNGEVLADLWNYDFDYQFWYPANLTFPGPGPRFGASGGIAPVSSSSQALTSTLLLAGGSNGSAYTADTWELTISGTLSSNNLGQVSASWAASDPTSPPGPARVGQASVVLSGSTLLSLGGCNASLPSALAAQNASCALPSFDLLSFPSGQVSSAPGWTSGSASCPGARYGPTLAPNLNPSSSSTYPYQAFLLFGALDPTQWNTSALVDGEVGILSTSGSTWARVVPSSGSSMPPWRWGASTISFSGPIVGPSSTPATDTLVFGGVDENGNYLNDLWLLRAFNGVVQSSTDEWSGYGDGTIVDGVTSQGVGVKNTYLTECVQHLQAATGTSSGGAPGPTSSGAPAPSASASAPAYYPYDASPAHKALSAISLAVFLPSLLLLRSASSSASPTPQRPDIGRTYLAALGAVFGYVLGVAGFALALATTTPVTPPSPLTRRATAASSAPFQTAHGQAGLALFVALYVLLPLWALCSFLLRRHQHHLAVRAAKGDEKLADSSLMSEDTIEGAREKFGEGAHELQQRYTQAGRDSLDVPADEAGRTRRVSSPSSPPPGGRLSMDWARNRRMSESALVSSAVSTPSTHEGTPSEPVAARSFEVVNRPRRVSGGASTSRLLPNDRHNYYHSPVHRGQQSLSDLSWLQRRGHIGGVAELDLALSAGTRSASGHGHGHSQSQGGQGASPEYFGSPDPLNPSVHDLPSGAAGVPQDGEKGGVVMGAPRFPSRGRMLFRDVLLATLTFGCVLALVALRQRAPVAAFAVFLAWTLLFYLCLVVLAARGRPDPSSLAVVIHRLRQDHHHVPVPTPTVHTPVPAQSPDAARSPPSTRPPSRAATGGLGPYTYHTPAYHRANSHDGADEGRPTSIEESVLEREGEDGDEDDEYRQRQIEQEIAGRDVVVMTIPRRQLKIVNV